MRSFYSSPISSPSSCGKMNSNACFFFNSTYFSRSQAPNFISNLSSIEARLFLFFLSSAWMGGNSRCSSLLLGDTKGSFPMPLLLCRLWMLSRNGSLPGVDPRLASSCLPSLCYFWLSSLLMRFFKREDSFINSYNLEDSVLLNKGSLGSWLCPSCLPFSRRISAMISCNLVPKDGTVGAGKSCPKAGSLSRAWASPSAACRMIAACSTSTK